MPQVSKSHLAIAQESFDLARAGLNDPDQLSREDVYKVCWALLATYVRLALVPDRFHGPANDMRKRQDAWNGRPAYTQ